MRVVKLGDICHVIAGQSPSGTSYNDRGEGIEFHQGKKYFGNTKLIESKVYTNAPSKFAEPGDILMSVRAPVGPVNHLDRRICIGRGLAAIRPGKEVDKEYLFHYLRSIEASITGRVGATFASINKNDIAALAIPLPELSEQKKIVSKLNTAFEKVELALRLTQQNIGLSQALFRSLRLETLKHSYVCPVVHLGSICSLKNGRAFKKEEWRNNGMPIIRIQNLNGLSNEYNYYDGEYDSSIEVSKGDLLFSWSGTVGTSFGPHIWSGQKAVLNQHIFKVNIDKRIVSRMYLYHYLKEITSEIEKQTHGAGGLVHITKVKLENMKIKLPSVYEQERLAKNLSGYEAKIQSLQQNYAKRRAYLEALKKSMLNEAFSVSDVK